MDHGGDARRPYEGVTSRHAECKSAPLLKCIGTDSGGSLTQAKEMAMSDTTDLLSRIDAEFRTVDEKIKQLQTEKAQEFEGRQRRLEQFAAVCERLQEVWRPRLEALSQRFKSKVQVVPNITKSRRSATVKFDSKLAIFNLTLTAMTDLDVRNLVLDYTLEILPILMRYEKNRQLELPLDKVEPGVVGKWIDDRIVEAVQTYLQLHQNSYYLKGHLVQDPIAGVEFPTYAAAATLEWNGKTHHFISDETCDAFKSENRISPR
jgi:YHS domain-containing protein